MARPITFDRFEVGLDLRKGPSVSDANRLRELKNAYVTTGKVVRKRPGLIRIATLEPGTKGLVAGLGKLNTFYESGSVTHANALFQANQVAHPTDSQPVARIHKGDVFEGYLYVSVEYADGSIWHHYLDGALPSHITDANCPQSAAWIKMSSKIWAPDGDVVRFSATSMPRDWTTAEDAGFLSTGLQQTGALEALALGQQDRDLVVYFQDSAQIWVPDPDPALHVFKKPINGVGTRYPRSVNNVSGDSYFLSDFGFRSISMRGATDNLTDVDVGSPIDARVKPLLTAGIDPVSTYYAGGGQYWCAIGSSIFAYTFSRTMKISAWSEYTLGVSVDDFATLGGKLYIRSGDDVYQVDDAVFTDDGTSYEMVMEMPYLDFKLPGVMKQIVGVDAVIQGDADLQLRWDPRDPDLITDKIPLAGDTRPGSMTPVEVMATAVAPVITSTSNQAVQIDSLTFYYETLGVT